MIKRVAIFCETYNSYGELHTYYKSLQESLKETELCNVDFFVADNTEAGFKSIALEASDHMHAHVFDIIRTGVFGSHPPNDGGMTYTVHGSFIILAKEYIQQQITIKIHYSCNFNSGVAFYK